MDFMEKIAELRAEKAGLLSKAEELVNAGKYAEADAVTEQMAGINASIKSIEALASESRDAAKGAGEQSVRSSAGSSQGETKLFNSLGEQLSAIYNFRKNHIEDRRLQKVNNAVLGTNEGTGADGGFAIQTDFAGMILESAFERSPLLSRMDRFTCSRSANAMRWVQVDETDISKSVFGGVQMYWASEGSTVAASKPQFREMKLDLEKMMGFAYCTEEMLEDAAFMSGFFGTAFSLAADQLLGESVISGDGVGKPLGILSSKALITVAKEADQEAGTFTGKNALSMLSRAMPRGRERLVWLMHPDMEELLPTLAIENGGTSKFLWDPEGGLGNFDTQRVLGKPVLFDQNCGAPGTVGDVLLIDPKQYILLSKGTARQDWSIHVEFLTDQSCFRMVFRCNGAPKVSRPLTIKNSQKPRSPFVALADRK